MKRLLLGLCCAAALPLACQRGLLLGPAGTSTSTGGATIPGCVTGPAYTPQFLSNLKGSLPKWNPLPAYRSPETRATRAYRNLVRDAGVAPSIDFREGFYCGYCDVCRGSCGIVPQVPPKQYWTARYRTAAGHARAQDWFQGFSVGSTQALDEGQGTYNSVPIRGANGVLSGVPAPDGLSGNVSEPDF